MEQRPTLIGLGANLGDPRAQMTAAVRAISAWPQTLSWRVSALYRGPYIGTMAPQPDYWNAVMTLDTTLGPEALMARLRALQTEIEGGERDHEAPRRLDLDLLLAADQVREDELLCIPHPRLRERRFVLEPLVELHPELLLPPDALPARWLLGQAAIQAQRLERLGGSDTWMEEAQRCLP